MQNSTYPIDDRNDLLRKVFENLGYFVELVGDKNQPKIVINRSFAVSGFVKNKIFNFTTKPFGGTIVKTISLLVDNPISKEDLEELFINTQKREIWKLFIRSEDGTQLFYIKTEDKIPYFSTWDNRYFFDLEKANQMAQYLMDMFPLQVYISSDF